MPRAIQYQKGSIIYFENDNDDRIFILQKGVVILSSTDIETGETVTSQLCPGEFFGVKSALGHFPREETVSVLQETTAISMTVQEFEKIFSNNKDVIYKMLRVFSGQLREVHNKSKALLSNNNEPTQNEGMLTVASSLFSEKQYISCMDVCIRYLKFFPDSDYKEKVVKLYEHAKKFEEKNSSSNSRESSPAYMGTNNALAHFMLPAFERFQKKYDNGQVIICEHEPGDSFYLIQSGEVQLLKCVNDSIKKLDILRPGEFFGEMAILDNSPRSATCVANGPVQCLEFNKQNFEILVAGNPQIALILLKLFCKRIYDQKRRYKILMLKDPEARIAEVFCMYDEMYPSVKATGNSRQFSITLQDIVQWSGLPMATVHDEISGWESNNRVQVLGTSIIISDITYMKKLVDSRIAEQTNPNR